MEDLSLTSRLNGPLRGEPTVAMSDLVLYPQLDASIPLSGDQIGGGIQKTPRESNNYLVPALASSAADNQKRKRTSKQGRTEQQQQQLKQKLVSDHNSRIKLEQNRIAVSKCRQKKKMSAQNIEETRRLLESQHENLQLEYDSLSGTVHQLKSLLIAHSNCHDSLIDEWLTFDTTATTRQPLNNTLEAFECHSSGFDPLGTLPLVTSYNSCEIFTSVMSDLDEYRIDTSPSINFMHRAMHGDNFGPKVVAKASCIQSTVTGSKTGRQESSCCGLSAEQENPKMIQDHTKSTASYKRRQDASREEEIDEHRRGQQINEAIYEAGKLEERLQGWNKHQIDIVQGTSARPSRQE